MLLVTLFKKPVSSAQSLSTKQKYLRAAKNLSIFFVFCLTIAMGGLYCYFCPRLNMDFYRPALYHPIPFGNEKLTGFAGYGVAQPKDVYFPGTDGVKLHGWFFGNAKTARKVLMISHGNGGNVVLWFYRITGLKPILDQGNAIFLYDYRGYGRSTGTCSLDGLCRDGLSAYDQLTQKMAVDPKKIVLVGESMGTGVSCHIVARRSCAGMILVSSFSSLLNVAREKFFLMSWYPDFLYPDEMMRNDSVVQNLNVPLLLLHGGSDKYVPQHHSEMLYAIKPGARKLVIVKEADHSDPLLINGSLARKSINEFLRQI